MIVREGLAQLRRLLNRAAARSASAAPALTAVVFAAVFVALRFLPIGWPTYLGVFAIAASAALLYSQRHGITKAVSAGYGLLGVALAMFAAFGAISSLQRSLKGEHRQPPLEYTLKPYGEASNVASDRGVAVVRTCPRLRCREVARLIADDVVYMRCWTTGDWFSDRYGSDRWFWIRFGYHSRRRTGYIHSSEVIGQASTPRCRQPSLPAGTGAASPN